MSDGGGGDPSRHLRSRILLRVKDGKVTPNETLYGDDDGSGVVRGRWGQGGRSVLGERHGRCHCQSD